MSAPDLTTPCTSWRATPHSSVVGCGVVGARGVVIATIPGSKEHAEPVARLVAAAPELLAACKETLAHPAFPACDCGEEDCATSRLRAAIAKAEGRP